MPKKKNAKPKPSSSPTPPATTTTATEEIRISEDEQWRIIEQSGVLEGMTRPSTMYKRRTASASSKPKLKRTTPEPAPPKIEELVDSDEEREFERDEMEEISEVEEGDELEGDGEEGDGDEEDLPDQIFQAVTLIVPLATLFVLMDLCVLFLLLWSWCLTGFSLSLMWIDCVGCSTLSNPHYGTSSNDLSAPYLVSPTLL